MSKNIKELSMLTRDSVTVIDAQAFEGCESLTIHCSEGAYFVFQKQWKALKMV